MFEINHKILVVKTLYGFSVCFTRLKKWKQAQIEWQKQAKCFASILEPVSSIMETLKKELNQTELLNCLLGHQLSLKMQILQLINRPPDKLLTFTFTITDIVPVNL